ncbi:MAG: phospholipase D-like domain-containing protein, partial [Promicromonosporaceae bacterium]|nr:phospholipase D-like domain-containing protein [Promicromonosporaceae bacterium]
AQQAEREAAVGAPDAQPIARILIGMATRTAHDAALAELQNEIDGKTPREADRKTARTLRAELLNHLREQLTRGIPTLRERETLASLANLLKRGAVEIKVFTRKPLHGKTYIFHRDDITSPLLAFVGSSNFTVPGLHSNLELNFEVTDQNAAHELHDWFEERWNDRYSMPITAHLLEMLTQEYTPYEVYSRGQYWANPGCG